MQGVLNIRDDTERQGYGVIAVEWGTGCGKMGLAALGASKSFRQFYGFKEYPDDTKEQLEECIGSPPKAFYSMD